MNISVSIQLLTSVGTIVFGVLIDVPMKNKTLVLKVTQYFVTEHKIAWRHGQKVKIEATVLIPVHLKNAKPKGPPTFIARSLRHVSRKVIQFKIMY